MLRLGFICQWREKNITQCYSLQMYWLRGHIFSSVTLVAMARNLRTSKHEKTNQGSAFDYQPSLWLSNTWISQAAKFIWINLSVLTHDYLPKDETAESTEAKRHKFAAAVNMSSNIHTVKVAKNVIFSCLILNDIPHRAVPPNNLFS